MATEKHRRARIVDALFDLFEPLREDSDDPYGRFGVSASGQNGSKAVPALDSFGSAKGDPIDALGL